MTKLTFAPHARIDFPVEVRRPNMALVGRTVASSSIDVSPGTYFVTASFPNGDQVTQPVDVAETDDSKTVHFPMAVEEDSPLFGSTLGGDAPPVVTMTGATERAAREFPAVQFSLWAGNAFARLRIVEDVRPLLPGDRRRVDGSNEPQLARITGTELDRWFVLPAWGESFCRFAAVSQPESDECDLAIALDHRQANLLLELRATGQISEEQTATDSVSLTSERLLRDKRRNPVAAVVSAYTLLRFNELERLHDWTKNMFRWFETLPDAAVLYGEHLGRLGDHEEALAALLALEARGLPLFSEGIRLAIDRLTLYERYGGKTFSQDQRHAAARLSRKLEDFAAVTDFKRQTTTFRGKVGSEP
jgi:hypothetical protein